MKNHWLDKKVDREIDAALAEIENTKIEFKDTDFIDLSNIMSRPDRYKEYDRMVAEDKQKASEKFIEEINAQCGGSPQYDVLTSTDKQDREMIKTILLKNMHKTHWIEEVLADVHYTPHLAPGCDPSIREDWGNLTISGVDWASGVDQTVTSYVTNVPGGDGIALNDNITVSAGNLPGWEGDKLVDIDLWKGKCDICGEYQWPMNDENTMTQGDPMCKCYSNSNLEIWWGTPFIQNEKLQVRADINTGVTQYQTMYTPVLAGTMTGTIYPTPGNTSYGFTFVVSSDGKFTFDAFVQDSDGNVEYASKQNKYPSDEACLQAIANGEYDERFMGWYDEVYAHETSLNLATGVLELHYHMGHQPEVFVSYEYNLDLYDGEAK
jgi:hypothetical protein